MNREIIPQQKIYVARLSFTLLHFGEKNKHFCKVESPKKVLLKRNLKRNFSLGNLDLNLEIYT